MAVINPTVTRSGDFSVITYKYETLTNGDTGAPIKKSEFADRSLQVFGTWGAGGTIVWEGSNDGGTTWTTLTDPQGNALSNTADFLEAVLEITDQARPNVTAGDGTTDLDCWVVCRRPNNMRT